MPCLLQEAGCFSLVLESVPARLAELISKRLEIPTIGIGAGAGCDGQVLVTHDVLGLFDRFTPRFVKKYADLHFEMARAFAALQGGCGSQVVPGSRTQRRNAGGRMECPDRLNGLAE